MAITRASPAQKAGVTSSGTKIISVAFPNNVTAGNLLVVGLFGCYGDTAPQIGDMRASTGTAVLGTWTIDVTRLNNSLNLAVYSVPVVTGGSCTINYNSTGYSETQYPNLALQEYAGADISSTRVRGTNYGTGSTGNPSTGTVDSVGGGVFVGSLAIYGSNTTITPGADFSEIYENQDGNYEPGACEDRIVTTGTVDAADWVVNPTTQPWEAVVVVYKEAEATPVKNWKRLMFKIKTL